MVYLEKFQNKKIHSDNSNGDSKKEFCRKKLIEFCNRTDLHGYKYIVMDDFGRVERSCWAIAIAVSVACAAYFVVTSYRWYARNPIVTVIESTQGAIWEVPFPAVTICDLNVVSRKAARDLANNLTLPANVTSDFVFKTFRLVPLLYAAYMARPEQKRQLQVLQKVLDLNNITVPSMFEMLSPASSCTQLVQRCMWKNQVFRCEELFTEIFTLLSVCCTFNFFAIDDFRKKGINALDTPRRVASCGYQTALTVLVHTDPDDYYSSTVSSQGALVIIDDAYNIPDLDSPVRLVNPATEVLIALSPERTYTTSGVKSFTPEQRQCYYNNEIKLGRFQKYTFHNCMSYQKVLILLQICGCIIPSYFPTKEQHRSCNFSDMDCVDNVLQSHIGYLDALGKRTNQSGLFREIDSTDVSQCLPECEHYDYPLEVALGKLADNMHLKSVPFFDDITFKNHSLLNVFFNDLVSTRYRRDVYLNWQNILAAFGGLLSLMLGFTIIAGFDLIIYFTMRVPYDYVTMFKTKNKPNTIHVVENKKNAWMDPATPVNNKSYRIYKGDSYFNNDKY